MLRRSPWATAAIFQRRRTNRIQVPSDCVNALAVGACDNDETPWQRCAYSSVGPGRSPGVVEADFVDLGVIFNVPSSLCMTIANWRRKRRKAHRSPRRRSCGGGWGTRAFRPILSILAIRALLVHTTEPSDFPCEDVGRGRVARALEEIVICDDDTVRVVYQGNIAPTCYIRRPFPCRRVSSLAKSRSRRR